jgi:hypothetical protein
MPSACCQHVYGKIKVSGAARVPLFLLPFIMSQTVTVSGLLIARGYSILSFIPTAVFFAVEETKNYDAKVWQTVQADLLMLLTAADLMCILVLEPNMNSAQKEEVI